ncbi:MAG: pseudouridine synthase [Eubacteriales bacterium]|nr:pseudouridine synthase [Eubacteriales bacterium]
MAEMYEIKKNMEAVRINKFLSEIGYCSRREADKLIEAGRITVNDHLGATGEKVTPSDQILVDGKPVHAIEKKVLLLFYKPKGIVCSTKKQGKDMTVTEYLNYPLRIYPIGRLDKDSSGLLLMTNQGDLVNAIMRARNHHEKEYIVRVNKPFDDTFVERMSMGVPILDTVTRPCKVRAISEDTFRIVLTQGLNRQIRRMCEYLGYKVISLKRTRIMNLKLDTLKKGTYREIKQSEWKELAKTLKLSENLIDLK